MQTYTLSASEEESGLAVQFQALTNLPGRKGHTPEVYYSTVTTQ